MELTLKLGHGVPFLACPAFDAAGGVVHGFSTRQGGVSSGIWSSLNLGFKRGDDPDRVRENYRRFCAAIGADMDRVVKSHQVHGCCVRPVTAADAGVDVCTPAPYEADGLITDEPGLCLTVFSADCVPVLLFDPVRRVIAAVHSGWRGTAQAIAAQAVEQMAGEYGCRREDILAAIGPGISQCCFETHDDVPQAMTEAFGDRAAPFILPAEGGKFRVDLKGIIRHCLTRAGLRPDHIAVSSHCTACMPEYYWSHRIMGGQRGSMAAMIQLTGREDRP